MKYEYHLLCCCLLQAAELLLFVIDNSTRAVVSLCEIAYLVGELLASVSELLVTAAERFLTD